MDNEPEPNAFLTTVAEDGDLNQYWYSKPTIKALVGAVVEMAGARVAFLSTPSLYFSLPEDVRERCFVMDYDKQWESDPGFVFYDFNKPTDLAPPTAPTAADSAPRRATSAADLAGSFDAVVIDPPFITEEVWRKYAETAQYLLKAETSAVQGLQAGSASAGGIVLGTTVAENAPLLEELFGATPQPFRPSIPNLVYQYETYCNFAPRALAAANAEIPGTGLAAASGGGGAGDQVLFDAGGDVTGSMCQCSAEKLQKERTARAIEAHHRELAAQRAAAAGGGGAAASGTAANGVVRDQRTGAVSFDISAGPGEQEEATGPLPVVAQKCSAGGRCCTIDLGDDKPGKQVCKPGRNIPQGLVARMEARRQQVAAKRRAREGRQDPAE